MENKRVEEKIKDVGCIANLIEKCTTNQKKNELNELLIVQKKKSIFSSKRKIPRGFHGIGSAVQLYC